MTERTFDIGALTRAACDTFTVRRVFGEAYEHGGRLVVPVARVTGLSGAGGGSGAGPTGDRDGGADDDTAGHEASCDEIDGASAPEGGSGEGGGGGFAAHVTPVGVLVVDDDGAHWEPTLDLNRVILGGQVVGAVIGCAWALAWALRRR